MLDRKLSNQEQLDEKFLLKEFVHGDYQAYTKLYETHVTQVTHYAFKFTTDIQIIEDCIHDVFVYLWNNRNTLEIKFSFKAYLFKSVRSAIFNKLKKNKMLTLLDEGDYSSPSNFYISAEDKLIEFENDFLLKERLTGVLGLLTPKQKEVIYLRFYQGLSFDEIAINMNLSIKACYKLMGRAISELRKTFVQPAYSSLIIFLFFI